MITMSAERSSCYPIEFVAGSSHKLPPEFAARIAGRRILLCTTPTVGRLYGERFATLLAEHGATCASVTLDIDESTKSMATLTSLCDRILAAGLGRRDVVAALGGGVLSDTVRMAAALVRRGIGHVCIPTTLIGQIDAAIGAKAAVNFHGEKSYLGAFHPPEAVLINPELLSTLPANALRDGFAEAVKVAIVRDADLFEMIEQYGPALIDSGFADHATEGGAIIRRSIELAVDELSLDLFERGSLRRLLDFGHSFSPAIESAADFTLSHGEAVAIDMVLSSAVACVGGLIDRTTYRRIWALIGALGLPRDSHLVDAALMDRAIIATSKHRDGCPNLIVPTRIGQATFLNSERLEPSTLSAALALVREETRSPDARAAQAAEI